MPDTCMPDGRLEFVKQYFYDGMLELRTQVVHVTLHKLLVFPGLVAKGVKE